MKSRVFSLLVLLLAPWAALHAAAAAKSSKPNFIVILSDDQSWVGTSQRMIPGNPETASDYFRTPNIERLAAQGMVFSSGYSPAPFCCPTRRSLQVSQTPARHEYQADREGWPAAYRQQLNIPRMLKAADPLYRTAHFGKWDHRYDRVSPADQGYDVSDGVTTNGDGNGTGSGAGKKSGKTVTLKDPKLVNSLTERASAFLEEQVREGRPFYLQVSHYAVHLDIQHSAAALERTKSLTSGKKHNLATFAAMTDDLDAGIGRLMEKVRALGLLENTYIFFLSDNGGRVSLPGSKDLGLGLNHPLRGGKATMYEGGIRVPFIVLGPGVKPGSVSAVPVTGLDFLPTMAELAGYRPALPATMDGGSITSVLHNAGVGDVKRQRPYLIFHQAYDRNAQSALRWGDFKLVKTWKTGRLELFDLSKDLSEANDLSAKMPEKTKELDRTLTAFLTQVKATTVQTKIGKDE
ncbi:MAG: sulfatase [Opitutus sp.]|nr:sulfatase [Opitutus sp.]